MICLDVIVITDQSLDFNDRAKVQELLKDVPIISKDSFIEVQKTVKEKEYRLVALMTNNDTFPDDWRIPELETFGTLITMIKVNKHDLFMLSTFLRSVGILVLTKSSSPPADSNIPPLIYKSLVYIEENMYQNDLTLDKVASNIYISRCHFSRIFKSHLGQGFKEYVINKRIQKAKIMLQEGNSVTEVCYSVGYGDLTHFGRIFKKIVGINPSLYRKKALKTNK